MYILFVAIRHLPNYHVLFKGFQRINVLCNHVWCMARSMGTQTT